MRLRCLQERDAPLMLEWMHDPDAVRDLKTDFASKTLDDCRAFIRSAEDESRDWHRAVVDDNDVYMGTVSLKHIRAGTAEFGISVRRAAMGKGYSAFAMREALRIGLEELKLRKIYWCVSPLNARAVRFYEKQAWRRCEAPEEAQGYTRREKSAYLWYEADGSEPQLRADAARQGGAGVEAAGV